ncbi:hypothetical protein [Streptomyces sp. A012304]|uniref:hypothetical protein n=1 Tax=Streptomyces sp. A012304 TaxID=375446 RepID=UPI002230AD3A|nr:hypothetical protein [Streptomyces sp. A012304]GKQ36747.1 hypothetical protein ALMP_32870 [Streptomyces sp. A012304]
MSGEADGVIYGWLLGFAVFNVVLGGIRMVRTREDRRLLRRLRGTDLDLFLAAWWLGGGDDHFALPLRERYPAEIAVRLLVRDGHLEVSREGRLTIAAGEREAPADPVPAALLAGVRDEPGVTLYELLTMARFLPFQRALDERRPGLKDHYFGGYRVAALIAAYVMSFGLGMHAMALGHGVPGLSGEPANWILAWTAFWAAFSLLAALWPPDHARPWRRFTRRCRNTVRRALAGERQEVVWWIGAGALRPAAPPPADGQPSANRGGGPRDDMDADLDLDLGLDFGGGGD